MYGNSKNGRDKRHKNQLVASSKEESWKLLGGKYSSELLSMAASSSSVV